jgi:LysM repeat protein
MYRHIITLLLLGCVAFNAAAQDVQLQENHPDRHVVVKGDTLWDISAKFLKSPWLWPKVWKMNREQIKNPHLIYPGDVIVLDLSGGTPQLRLLRETVNIEPGLRIEPLEREPIATISPHIIAPFLSKPLVIEKDALADVPSIIGSREDKVVLGPHSRIYTDRITEDQGRYWSIYRDGKSLIDPKTKELLGIEAIYLGDAVLARYGEPATLDISRANQEIFKGDKLIVTPDNITKSSRSTAASRRPDAIPSLPSIAAKTMALRPGMCWRSTAKARW